jgi:DNA primase
MERIQSEAIERARQRLDVILGDVPHRREGREFAGCCPFHNEKTPSFYIVPDKAMFHCFGCGAHGDAISYVMRRRGLNFMEAVAELNGTPLTPASTNVLKRARRDDRPDDIAAARAIWAEASPELYYVRTYLASRGLSMRYPIPPSIREHPALYCNERHAPFPAMIAAFKDSTGHITAIQRTWIDGADAYIPGNPKGTRLADAKKRTRGEMRDGCIRLAPAAPLMGLAEGTESAMSARELESFPAVWACGGTTRMPSVWIPDICVHLVIFADRGEAGESWADKAAEAHYRKGRRAIEIRLPKDGADDWNDELQADIQAGRRR